MKKIIYLTIVILLSFSIFTLSLSNGLNSPFSISAQESTSSAEDITKKVKERLEKVAKEGEVLGETVKKAYVGTLESLTQNTLTIKTAETTKTAAVADKAKIIGLKREALKIDDLEIGSFLIVMGYATDKNVLDARRVVVSDKPQAPPYTVSLTKYTGQLELAKNAIITQTFEDNQTEIESTDLKVDDTLVVITNAKSQAVAVHLVTGRPIISQDATPSASPKE